MQTSIIELARSTLLSIALTALIGCAAEDADIEAPPDSTEESLGIAGYCSSGAECAHPNVCRACEGGLPSCATSACVQHRCVVTFPSCPTIEKVFCGGIAAIPCKGAGQCVDDPSDGCDPKHGGADCGGMCVCGPQKQACAIGSHWDSAPAVCACVPDATGPKCGNHVCPAGDFCCNASCGSCAPKGGACTQNVCLPVE